ncbi:MAG: OsmC family protein [Chitinophagaceae bacterium]|nr:OsmC family protein [Oligoflexus sp.]
MVGIGPIPECFGLEAELNISIPGLKVAKAQELIEKAHQVCPYLNVIRGNINVTLKMV